MKDPLEQLLPRTRRNVSLARYATFRVGGPARYFFVAASKEAIVKAILAAKQCRIPFFVLAGGSNLLISDKGFQGLVILARNTSYAIRSTTVQAEAGTPLSALVKECALKRLAGLEWAGGLPGSFGGAVRGNAGAFGGEMKDSVVRVECVDEKGNVSTLSNAQCKFSYRSSIFKKKNWTVLAAVLHMKKGNISELRRTAADHIRYRKERHPLEYPNAGSIFTNVPLNRVLAKLRKEFQPVVKQDPFSVVPAAYLIARSGMKGKSVGGAQVSEKHTNVIINRDNASSHDILALIDAVKKAVRKKFSIALEQEVQYIE
ncbi:MAG: UDP-N-acetylmuramate dehydrogenase [Candidatus Wildermuthbacteria bacterium]|nr:UDP-N-acetylmuramate dehydrogenase [Candidatus Wildermuthbacteria bacterium]